MFGLGTTEIIVIVVAILVLFGGKKIPEFMRGLGRGVREFNDAKTNVQKELNEGMREKDNVPPPPVSTPVNTVNAVNPTEVVTP